jgi:hypothetical protein
MFLQFIAPRGFPTNRESTVTLKIVHIHGFKCAGTTFSSTLAANFDDRFRCMEPKSSPKLNWESARLQSDQLGLGAISSHSLRVPAEILPHLQFVHLIREPTARLLSAWNFEVAVQKRFEGPFSSYLDARKHNSNHQSRFLLQPSVIQKFDLTDRHNAFLNYFKHRPNLFLGVVDRYDESMTVLEQLLRQKSINIDLSYSIPLNQKRESAVEMTPDVATPADFVNVDEVLYQLANKRLDLYISLYPDFVSLLHNFRARCKLSLKSKQRLMPQIQNENWLFID